MNIWSENCTEIYLRTVVLKQKNDLMRYLLVVCLLMAYSCNNEENEIREYKYVGYEKLDSAFYKVDMDFNEIDITSDWPSSVVSADELFDLGEGIANLSSISIDEDSLTLHMIDGTLRKMMYEEFSDLIAGQGEYTFYKPSADTLRFSSCALFRYEDGSIVDLTEKVCENQIASIQVSNFFNDKQLKPNDAAGGYIIWGTFVLI